MIWNKNEPTATYIYGLIDPMLHKICYIGRTINLYGRLEQHVEEVTATIKGEWIKRLRAAGIRPTLVVLDYFEDGNAEAIETWWIEFGRRAGWPLTNTIGIDSEKYNMASLPMYGGEEGYWENGAWHKGSWWQLPDTEEEPEYADYWPLPVEDEHGNS